MPRGQTHHLREHQIKQKGKSPLAKTPLSIRLPVDIDSYVRALPDRNKWLQEVIAEQVFKHATATEETRDQ